MKKQLILAVCLFSFGGLVFVFSFLLSLASLALLLSSVFGTVCMALGTWGVIEARNNKTGLPLVGLSKEWHVFSSVRLPTQWGSMTAVLLGPTGLYIVKEIRMMGIVTRKKETLIQNGFERPETVIPNTALWCSHLADYIQKHLHEKVLLIPVVANTEPLSITVHSVSKKQSVSLISGRSLFSFLSSHMHELPHKERDLIKLLTDISS
jgi:hypothetical protein